MNLRGRNDRGQIRPDTWVTFFVSLLLRKGKTISCGNVGSYGC